MNSTKITEEDLAEALMEKQEKRIDEKQKWVNRILRSARQYHKMCPYFDKRTKMCFITMGTRCEREGKFDTCPVFKAFLEKKYDEYKSKKQPLPYDFADVTLASI